MRCQHVDFREVWVLLKLIICSVVLEHVAAAEAAVAGSLWREEYQHLSRLLLFVSSLVDAASAAFAAADAAVATCLACQLPLKKLQQMGK